MLKFVGSLSTLLLRMGMKIDNLVEQQQEMLTLLRKQMATNDDDVEDVEDTRFNTVEELENYDENSLDSESRKKWLLTLFLF